MSTVFPAGTNARTRHAEQNSPKPCRTKQKNTTDFTTKKAIHGAPFLTHRRKSPHHSLLRPPPSVPSSRCQRAIDPSASWGSLYPPHKTRPRQPEDSHRRFFRHLPQKSEQDTRAARDGAADSPSMAVSAGRPHSRRFLAVLSFLHRRRRRRRRYHTFMHSDAGVVVCGAVKRCCPLDSWLRT